MPSRSSLVPSRLIVLGASGFIGSSMFEYFSSRSSIHVVPSFSKDLDLLDHAAVRRFVEQFDSSSSYLFCAGVPITKRNTWESMLKNIEMARTVAETLASNGALSMIFVSSVEIYGRPCEPLPVTESTSPGPLSYYGLAKLASEKIYDINLSGKVPVTILRCPGIYGKRKSHPSVVGLFIEKIMNDEPITVTGNGRILRDYLAVGDLCRIVESFLETPYDGMVNVASGRSITIRDIIEMIANQLGKEPNIVWSAEPGQNDFDLKFEVTRLNKLLPEFEPIGLEQGIRKWIEDDGYSPSIVSET